MHANSRTALVAALLLAACSGPGREEASKPVQTVTADTPTIEPAAAGHDMHAMPDTTARPSHDHHGASGAMAGMDHNAMAATSGAGATDHAGMQGMDHGQAHSTAGSDERRAGSAETSAHAAGGHAGHAMSGSPAIAGTARSRAPSAHAGHVAGRRQDSSAAMAEMHQMDHAQRAAPSAIPAGEGMDKILTLVQELVQDSAVLQRIRQDSVLREAWADPGVRRLVLQQP